MKIKHTFLISFISILCWGIALIGLSGCEKEKEDQPQEQGGDQQGQEGQEEIKDPTLAITPEIIEATFKGGDFSVSYKIENPVENEKISVDCNSDWITDMNLDTDGKILFKVTKNSIKETRETVVKVSYCNISPVPSFTVKQEAYKSSMPEDAVFLSEKGTSNSYIATPGAKAYFGAEFKGNSTTETIGDATQAKLLWQSQKDLVTEVKYYSDEKNILVNTNEGISGNAVVAAMNDAGQILWSWHLWITDYNPEATAFTTPANSTGTTWTFMDRNLGATTVERGNFDSNGMMYQWGRKDPFPGTISFTVMNEDYTYEVDGEPTVYDIDNNELPKFNTLADYHGTIEKSIQNPMTFYAMTYVNTGEKDEYGQDIMIDDYKTGDWTDPSNDDYWGGESGKKTIYDPCPPGYKVPVCDAKGNTPYAWLDYKKKVWDNENRGCEQDGQWFPTTGSRVYASGSLDYPETGNQYGGLWIGTKGKCSSDLITYPTLYGQYMFIINGKRLFKVNKDKRSQGLSVRCVKE